MWNRIIQLILLVFIAMILYIAYISWPVADDFSHFVDMKACGHFYDYAWQIYNRWDGRYLSYLIMTILFFNPMHMNYIVMFYVLALIFSAIAFVNLWHESFFPKFRYFDWCAFLLTLCGLWLGLRPIIAQTVYWASGGVCAVLLLLLVLIWLSALYYYLYKGMNFRWRVLTVPLFFIYSSLVAMGYQALPPAIVFLVFVMLFGSKRQSEDKHFVVLCLILYIAGAIFMYLAPGNFQRAREGPMSFVMTPAALMKNFLALFAYFTYLARYTIPYALLGGFVSSVCVCNYESKKVIETYAFIMKTALIRSGVFMIAAVLAMLPFICVVDFASARTSFFFQIFLFLAFWHLGSVGGSLIWRSDKNIVKKPAAVLGKMILIIISTHALVVAFKDIKDGRNISYQMKDRHKILSEIIERQGANQIINISINPIFGRVPQSLYFDDIKTFSEFWANDALARYYGFGQIRLKEKEEFIESMRRYGII